MEEKQFVIKEYIDAYCGYFNNTPKVLTHRERRMKRDCFKKILMLWFTKKEIQELELTLTETKTYTINGKHYTELIPINNTEK